MQFFKFTWWKDVGNRGAVTAILGVASAICAAGVYVFLNDDTSPSAQAAYDRGEISEAELRWQDAAQHYARAAELDPSLVNLNKACEFAWRAGDYDAALRFGQMALDHATTHGTPEERATALNNLALVIEKLGQYGEAEGLLREVLEIGRATIGTGHPGYAIRLNNLAGVVEARCEYTHMRGHAEGPKCKVL